MASFFKEKNPNDANEPLKATLVTNVAAKMPEGWD